MGLADLHMHTIFSYDGTATVPAVLARAKEIGLDVIAITDHDEIRGSLEARELASQYNVEVVTGVEVGTREGHLLALYVDRPMPKGLPLIEAIQKAAEQRLRPVLMTASIAIFSLIPMVFATGPGSEVQRPLAVVVVGGLITSTLLTLLVLPTIYALLAGRAAAARAGGT